MGRPFYIKLGEDNNPVLLRQCRFRSRLSLDLELSDTSVVLGKIILQNRAEVIEICVIVERIESSLENHRTGAQNRNSDRLGISPYGILLGRFDEKVKVDGEKEIVSIAILFQR